MSTITPKDNGPLIVKDVPNLRNQVGDIVSEKGSYALCRCGLSANKPYCDGAHNAAGFESANDGPLKRNRIYSYEGQVEGQDVVVTFNPALCAHAAECGRLHKEVFNTKQNPWVQPENGTVEGIKSVVKGCPSGALRAGFNGNAPTHDQEGDVAIQVVKNGPYKVTNVSLDAEVEALKSNPNGYLLCRCGQSKNKPFCDGAHHGAKFEAD